jgi:acetylornithine deacetylase
VEIAVHGRAAHGSRPQEGRDAIVRMGRVLSSLESLDRRLQAGPPHELLGAPSLHASVIAGGTELSTYPDRCVLQIERRALPGERQDAALLEVQGLLDECRRHDHEFRAEARQMFRRPAYEIDPSHALPGMLRRAAESVGCRPDVTGMTYWSDAAILGAAGIPAVLFGPGGAGLHSREEYVRLDDVLKCRDALVVLARQFMQ